MLDERLRNAKNPGFPPCPSIAPRSAALPALPASPSPRRRPGRLEQELSGILDWVAQLDEIDTSAVEPMTRVAAMTMKKRKDEVTDGFCAADILKNAPAVDDGYFVVPKIVE